MLRVKAVIGRHRYLRLLEKDKAYTLLLIGYRIKGI
jgi:hypothetical protein